MQKRNFQEHKYYPYEIPSDWRCPLLVKNINILVNCAECGKKEEFGKMYTSLSIHDSVGFGYLVCKNCHKDEMIMWDKYSFN